MFSRKNVEEARAPDAKRSEKMPRATYVLLLLDANRQVPIEGRTRLEKLLFLVQKKLVEEMGIGFITDPYSFRPLYFGPFTEDVYDDLDTLRTFGLVEIKGDDEATQKFMITAKGHEAVLRLKESGRVPSLLIDEIESLKRSYGRMNLKDLIERVYKQYPQYTMKSEIKGESTERAYIY